MRLVDQVALVTGGSRGIGKEIALALATEGCHVAVAGRKAELLKEVAQRIEDLGCQALSVKMDVTDHQDVARGVDRVKKRLGRIDFLINCAGIGTRCPLDEMRTQEIHQILDVNLLGVIECCRRVIPIMKEQESGCIINMASLAGTVGVPNMSVYAASKWAVRGLGLSLIQELRKTNIRVHNICPGSVDTDFFERFPEDDPILQEDPLLRLSPTDVAQAVVYLATLPERAKVDEIFIGARKIWMNR